MSLLDMPLDVRRIIAGIDGVACRAAFYYDPAFREIFEPRRHRELFITRETKHGRATTKLFGKLHSIDDLPADASTAHRIWY